MLCCIDQYETNWISKSNKKNSIYNYIHIKLPEINEQTKITKKNFKIPTTKEYASVIKFNYTIPMLKNICEKYNIPKSGNKQELIKNIYSFLYATNFIIKIQKKFRLHLKHKLVIVHGPAFNKKSLCINDTDFLTMESLDEIPDYNFYSFMDEDKIIYGFDLSSLLNAINKDSNFRNPYNRKALPISKIKNDIYSIIKLNKIFNIKTENKNTNMNVQISVSKIIELKMLTLCQKMDELGNYTDVNWFTSLNRSNIIEFIKELHDIWSYRAQLTDQVKREICPNFDPCTTLNLYQLNTISIEELKLKMIKLIENLIYKGINRDSQYLGASFVLSALTLVNENAAQSMPWLYYSVAHVQ
jgi:hypothetical protein